MTWLLWFALLWLLVGAIQMIFLWSKFSETCHEMALRTPDDYHLAYKINLICNLFLCVISGPTLYWTVMKPVDKS